VEEAVKYMAFFFSRINMDFFGESLIDSI
jgi:hypothetical protein